MKSNLFIFTLSTFLTTQVVASGSIVSKLNTVINNNNNDGSSSGSLIVESDPGYGAQLNASIYSYDNYVKIYNAYQSYEEAVQDEKFGDAVIYAESILFNGVTTQDLLEGDIAAAIITRAKSDSTLFDLWANTTTSIEYAEYFKNLKTLASRDGFETIQKRDNLQCSGSHVPNSGDCNNLKSSLNSESGSFVPKSPRNRCFNNCCVSWSSDNTMRFGDLAAAEDRCVSICVNNGQSCIIRDWSTNGKFLNFCTSNRADGCN
ncbi:hypothetical protein KGF54_001559 [Candida jiufengensis]|uniref:uncharacterized protein n=1 Tax=Candida jiufengensis TaxID=497108 RepID=UPI0022252531|nr:uncharacterized protein KGF54_001559 [Candida jiufengensis]KAI5954998.1 hypothetical protein KGF54_001559 [Candida jiufengensis]